MKSLTLAQAEKIAMQTDYAVFANEDTGEINTGDAGAFFLEGYEYKKSRKCQKLNNMNQDVECPYCKTWNEINHDDGFGYEENTCHQKECIFCEKTFVFTTSISFHYEAGRADCLNGEDHIYKLTNTHPKWLSIMKCKDCDKERELTKAERKEYDIETREEYIERTINKLKP